LPQTNTLKQVKQELNVVKALLGDGLECSLFFASSTATQAPPLAGCASKQKGHSLRLAAALQSVMRNLDIQLYGASDLSYGLITKEILEAAILLTTNFTAVHRADFSTEGKSSRTFSPATSLRCAVKHDSRLSSNSAARGWCLNGIAMV
jgi:hypothetical protein